MATYLDKIVAHHRARASADTRSLDNLVADAMAMPAARGFAASLRTTSVERLAVIAEIKRGGAEAFKPSEEGSDYPLLKALKSRRMKDYLRVELLGGTKP